MESKHLYRGISVKGRIMDLIKKSDGYYDEYNNWFSKNLIEGSWKTDPLFDDSIV